MQNPVTTGAATNAQGRLLVADLATDDGTTRALLEGLAGDGVLAVLAGAEVTVPPGTDLMRVDPLANNTAVLRRAVQWLRSGQPLVVLRGGETQRPMRSRVGQARWGRLVRHLARLGRADIVPVHVQSADRRRRPRWLPAPPVETAAPVVRIGDPLPRRKIDSFEADFEVGRYLRLRIGMLGASAQGRGLGPRHDGAPRRPLAAAMTREALAAEIARLPDAAHLSDHGPYAVYCAGADQLPVVLREIGRLRELTFRAVGEGTGGDVDLDVHDTYYRHLFIWQREREEIVGSYRLGLTDEILPRFGKRGLYSHTLFRFRTRLIQRLDPAIELGRSFVRPEYQREFQPLMLLWKGIAGFVVRNPRYSVLFGPVSISASYQTTSQQLLVDFLTRTRTRHDLARWVQPRRPFRGQRRTIWREADFAGIDSIDDLSELIAQIEADAKGVPVLLRQYLRVGGRLLGFNVDDQFSDVLDGLLMVDLLNADHRALRRYFGDDGLAAIEAYHAEREGAGARRAER